MTTSRGMPRRARFVRQCIWLIIPYFFILKLHRSLEGSGLVQDDFDVLPRILWAPLESTGPKRHLAVEREDYRGSNDEGDPTLNPVIETDTDTDTEKDSSITTQDNSGPGRTILFNEKFARAKTYAEVSSSTRRKVAAIRAGQQKSSVKGQQQSRDHNEEGQRNPQRRMMRGQKPRNKRYANLPDERERRRHEYKIYPENITSFEYKPVGVNADHQLKKRQTVKQILQENNSIAPYAYAFVMGGVNEEDELYLGMLYNILISAYILEKEGSIADVVVYVQMSANSTLTELPPDNTRLLEQLNVKIKYLPKPQVENFHQIIMQKMVVMELVQYRRVIFLDTDVMPYCNLDYVFELSDGPSPILKKNLIIALSGSPANAGFFMLSPKVGELAKLQRIVARQQEKAKELPYPHFDEVKGWGHTIRPPDRWWTINKRHQRRTWKFVGSHADQGLLYHWVKYVKRSVSIVSGVEVDNYIPKNDKDRVLLEETLVNPFNKYTCLPSQYENTFGELPTADAQGMAPYRDFVHFLGSKKPWRQRLPPPVPTNLESETPEQYWFFMLRLLNKEYDMGIDFENWRRIKRTPLGSLPKKDLMVELMQANQTLLQSKHK